MHSMRIYPFSFKIKSINAKNVVEPLPTIKLVSRQNIAHSKSEPVII